MDDRCRHDEHPDRCDACYAEDAHATARPVVSLADALAELEAVDKVVAVAAAELERVKADIVRRARRDGTMAPMTDHEGLAARIRVRLPQAAGGVAARGLFLSQFPTSVQAEHYRQMEAEQAEYRRQLAVDQEAEQ